MYDDHNILINYHRCNLIIDYMMMIVIIKMLTTKTVITLITDNTTTKYILLLLVLRLSTSIINPMDIGYASEIKIFEIIHDIFEIQCLL